MASQTPRRTARKTVSRKTASRKTQPRRAAAGRKRHPHIVHVDAVPWEHEAHGPRFEHQRKRLGRAAGGVQIGTSLLRLQPGKAAFPAHFHHGNEEAVFIVSGSGTIRIGAGEYPVAAGDYIALPAGTGEAHQVRNTSRAPLEYLVLSTMLQPEISEYPDSGKMGVFAGVAPGGETAKRRFYGFYMQRVKVDYYKGE
jgi:uncharacterized cupin superfamily protein